VTRADAHRLLLKATALDGERHIPAPLRAHLTRLIATLERLLHDAPADRPESWADVTAELGLPLAGGRQGGPEITATGIPEITPNGPGMRLVSEHGIPPADDSRAS
jgi:hypothetical protein